MSSAELASLVTRLEAAVQKLERKAGGGGGSGGTEATAQFVEDYDAFVEEYIAPYLKASAIIGGAVDEQAKILKIVSDEHRKFLVIVSKYSAPKDAATFSKLVAGIVENMGKMEGVKNKLDRKSNLVNHVRAVCEGIYMFGWISVAKTPMKQVQNIKETVMFYSNKVLTEFKNSDKKEEHRAWVAAYVKIFDGLREYIKEHHTTGPSWNVQAPQATPGAASGGAPPPPPDAPAPPPPPPAGAVAPAPAPSKAPSAGSVNALLQDINRGADVTKGLKKVTNDMKTHKNPELRKQHAPVPFKAAPASKPAKAQIAQAPAKPPKFELEGKKWVVEYQDKATLAIDDANMKQTVYIYKCNGCTVSVNEKVNSIVLDSCKKTGIVFTSVVSGVEVINCQSIQVQAQGQMHNVSIDKTDGCIVFLSKECINASIVTAKSSEMNVSIPKDDGDFVEYPIVEQFRTTWNPAKKTFVTVPSEQLG